MNQKAISQATKRYDGEVKKDYLLKPISKEDVEIIKELASLCEKANIKGIKEVMENYKVNPDKEVIEQLNEISTTFKSKPEKEKPVTPDISNEDKEYAIFRMIKFNDDLSMRIYQPNIVSYLKAYSDEDDIYSILINDCDETLQRQPMHANTFLIYGSQEDRDQDFEMLDEFFS